MQKIIAFVGISGVGKSTLLRRLASHVEFQHLQASSLIREERLRLRELNVASDTLRLADIDENQRMLVSAFNHNIDLSSNLVVLDGHTIIDTPSGLNVIDPVIFKYLNVSQLIFLSDEPSQILKRREGDTGRQRPIRDENALRQHQESALLSAFSISTSLKIPLSVVGPDNVARVVGLLALA